MTRMVIVPEDPTAEMVRAIETQNLAGYAVDAWDNAIAASPAQGMVTAAQLEAAAEAVYERTLLFGQPSWGAIGSDWQEGHRADVRAALSSLGLTVQP